jgi:branched-chain amino acid aminotransferase group I
MEESVYLNGSLVPRSQAHISVDDHGFLYGYGLFETMRAYHGKIFLLERHLKRLTDAAQTIGLAPALARVDLGKACVDTLRANGLQEARIRLTVSRGEADAFPWSGTGGEPTVVVTARSYTPFSAEIYNRGYQAGISSLRRGRSLASRIKSTNYLSSALARREALSSGLDEALLLNESGVVAEGSASNIFFVRDSGLLTPSLESGILPGITRQVVIELAEALSISVTEEDVSPAELRQFDEAFLTNSMIEIMPLVAIRDDTGQTVNIGPGKPGEVTRRLMAAYKERVERETQ